MDDGSLMRVFLGVCFALIATSLLLFVLGENPAVLFEALYKVLLEPFGLGYTLFYATPLIFTGLSVAIAYHCGLFNIGAEGQLYFGSLGIMCLYYFWPTCPFPFVASILVAFCFGGIWGGIAGFFKAVKGSHEVIVTILLNFIGVAFVDYFILYPFKNPNSQNPETFPISPSFSIAHLSNFIPAFQTTPVNVCLIFAIVLAILVHLFLFRTSFGFELRVVGRSERCAAFSGISYVRNVFLSLFISGGLAGLVGVNEILGNQHKLVQGFSPGYGFTGIAVALLSRSHPIAILASAFLFGAIHNMSRELEFISEKVSKELSMVIQAIMIAFIVAPHLIRLPKLLKGRLWPKNG